MVKNSVEPFRIQVFLPVSGNGSEFCVTVMKMIAFELPSERAPLFPQCCIRIDSLRMANLFGNAFPISADPVSIIRLLD